MIIVDPQSDSHSQSPSRTRPQPQAHSHLPRPHPIHEKKSHHEPNATHLAIRPTTGDLRSYLPAYSIAARTKPRRRVAEACHPGLIDTAPTKEGANACAKQIAEPHPRGFQGHGTCGGLFARSGEAWRNVPNRFCGEAWRNVPNRFCRVAVVPYMPFCDYRSQIWTAGQGMGCGGRGGQSEVRW